MSEPGVHSLVQLRVGPPTAQVGVQLAVQVLPTPGGVQLVAQQVAMQSTVQEEGVQLFVLLAEIVPEYG